MILNYILDENKNVIAVKDWLTWADFYEKSYRNGSLKVKHTDLKKYNIEISTVFLGICHNYCHKGPPIVFESMIFCGKFLHEFNNYYDRYSTYKEAQKGHREMVRMIIKEIKQREAK